MPQAAVMAPWYKKEQAGMMLPELSPELEDTMRGKNKSGIRFKKRRRRKKENLKVNS